MEYITKIKDCDLHLINFLFFKDIVKLRLINNSLHKLIINHKIYNSISQINDSNNILKTCYTNGLIDILKNYYYFDKNIIIDGGIDSALSNGHVEILE